VAFRNKSGTNSINDRKREKRFSLATHAPIAVCCRWTPSGGIYLRMAWLTASNSHACESLLLNRTSLATRRKMSRISIRIFSWFVGAGAYRDELAPRRHRVLVSCWFRCESLFNKQVTPISGNPEWVRACDLSDLKRIIERPKRSENQMKGFAVLIRTYHSFCP